MEVVDVPKLRADWAGVEFDVVEVEAKGDEMLVTVPISQPQGFRLILLSDGLANVGQ